MMSHYKHKFRDYQGWTEWQYPARRYKMACCDCGLVHDMRFEVRKISDSARGQFTLNGTASRRAYRVAFKIKRNKRATGQMRRKR